MENTIYFHNNPQDLSTLTTIRCGLECGSVNKDIFTPSFQLSHYLNNENSIELTEEERKRYLHGEEIKKDLSLQKGYYIVSFEGINLGFVKYNNGTLKNLYPKGLRH